MTQAFFGVIGIFLLCATLFYTARAANAAKSSADHARIALDHTVDSAEAATRSAEAAEAALGQSNQHHVRETRPWISITLSPVIVRDAIVPDPSIPKDFFQIQAGFKNIGRTPADNVKIRYEQKYVQMGEQPEWNDDRDIEGGILAPDDSGAFRGAPIFPVDFDAVSIDACRLVLRVAVTYRNLLTGDECETVAIYQADFATPFSAVLADNLSGVRFASLPGSKMI